MTLKTLVVIGVGLIGGSVALAAKRRGLAARVVGADCDPAALDEALRGRLLDEAVADPRTAVRSGEVVVFAAPVDRLAALVVAAAPHCAAGALLLDTGSTKAAVVAAVDGRVPSEVAFVGSHPLAGSEKRGAAHAREDLFQGRLAVLTPTPATAAAAVERATQFWEGLGARVRVMSPEDHDRALAVTSHLPQLAASALAGVLPPELDALTATGFRDTTRLAASNPEMWVGIFAQNRTAVLSGLRQFQAQLARFQAVLEADDRPALGDLLEAGRQRRQALDP